jgi:catechol 2,3-dioxygenase-like lactoylglutathione lyase family enzyme
MPSVLGVVPRLPAADLQRTIAFYGDHLGFALDGLWPDDAPTFAILERDGVSIQFNLAERAGDVGAATLNVEVDDARAVHAAISARVPVEWGPDVYWYGRREFAVRDPDGYLVIVTERTDDPPTVDDEA